MPRRIIIGVLPCGSVLESETGSTTAHTLVRDLRLQYRRALGRLHEAGLPEMSPASRSAAVRVGRRPKEGRMARAGG